MNAPFYKFRAFEQLVRMGIILRHYHLLCIYHFLLLFSTGNVLWCDFQYVIANPQPSRYSLNRGYPMAFKKQNS